MLLPTYPPPFKSRPSILSPTPLTVSSFPHHSYSYRLTRGGLPRPSLLPFPQFLIPQSSSPPSVFGVVHVYELQRHIQLPGIQSATWYLIRVIYGVVVHVSSKALMEKMYSICRSGSVFVSELQGTGLAQFRDYQRRVRQNREGVRAERGRAESDGAERF